MFPHIQPLVQQGAGRRAGHACPHLVGPWHLPASHWGGGALHGKPWPWRRLRDDHLPSGCWSEDPGAAFHLEGRRWKQAGTMNISHLNFFSSIFSSPDSVWGQLNSEYLQRAWIFETYTFRQIIRVMRRPDLATKRQRQQWLRQSLRHVTFETWDIDYNSNNWYCDFISHCQLAIKSDTGQFLQFLRCFNTSIYQRILPRREFNMCSPDMEREWGFSNSTMLEWLKTWRRGGGDQKSGELQSGLPSLCLALSSETG